MEEVSALNGEARLRRCARCGGDAAGELGHPMYGLLLDDLGAVPMFSIIREFGRTRLLIRLRLCNACHDEAQSYALDTSGGTDALGGVGTNAGSVLPENPVPSGKRQK
jgi:hypothetical protein